MATKSRIEWTESTWNPITGCTKISPGCKNCYAERMAKRLKAMGMEKYRNGFSVTIHPDELERPTEWEKPQMIFVNSMSDLFHEKVPLSFVHQVFDTMRKASWHTFQVLTKRSEKLLELNDSINWPENVWMGVSVENDDYVYRIDHLRQTNAVVKFLSQEPLLGPITNMELTNIDWVIVGGESGPNARPIKKEWVVSIHEQCISTHTPFFFKQWGGVNKKANGRLLEGRTWDEMPQQFENISTG
jgi:protein gp37